MLRSCTGSVDVFPAALFGQNVNLVQRSLRYPLGCKGGHSSPVSIDAGGPTEGFRKVIQGPADGDLEAEGAVLEVAGPDAGLHAPKVAVNRLAFADPRAHLHQPALGPRS